MTTTEALAVAQPQPRRLPSMREALRVWLRVAALSFGGPAGQIAVMHRILVEEKRWVSEARFLHALNYCMLLPGPEAQQLATYIGWLMHRTAGGIMAGGLFVLPGIIAIMALSWLYAAYGQVPLVTSFFFGLKAAVLAIVIEAVVRIGKRALDNDVLRALAAIAFVGIYFFDVPFPLIVLGAGLVGFFGARAGWAVFKARNAHGGGEAAAGRRRQSARRRGSGPRPARCAPGDLDRHHLDGAVARPGHRGRRDARDRRCLQQDRDLLQQDGGRDLRRRLRGARLCRPAGGRTIRLAHAPAKCSTASAWRKRRRAR